MFYSLLLLVTIFKINFQSLIINTLYIYIYYASDHESHGKARKQRHKTGKKLHQIRNLKNPLYIVYFTQFKISMKRPYTTYGGIYDKISSLQEAFH